jgi:hypothetical protein
MTTRWTPEGMNASEQAGFLWGSRHLTQAINMAAKAHIRKLNIAMADKLQSERDFTRGALSAQIAARVKVAA